MVMGNGPIPVLGFKILQRVTDGGYTYIVGKCGVPDTFVLGVMDLTDPKAWSESISDNVLYFIITPEESALRVSDPEGFNRLAQSIQQSLPKSRYLFGRSSVEKDGNRVDEACRELLKEESLEGDEVFENWLKTHPVKIIHQQQTPYTIARKELAQYQKDFNRNQAPKNAVVEELHRQRTFAKRLMELPCIYAGIDDTAGDPRRPDLPTLEITTGHAHLFSREDIANTACEYFRDNHFYRCRVKKLEGEALKDYLRLCEELGVAWFRVDDGIEPVEVRLELLQEPAEWEWLEEQNQQLRNAMLHSLQLTALLRSGGALEERWKHTAEEQIILWKKRMLGRAAESLFYVPCALSEELREQVGANKAFTKRSLAALQKKLRENGRPNSALTEPGFTGNLVTVHAGEGSRLPLRVLNGKDGNRWIIAFTGREICRTFIERSGNEDTMVLMTFDELKEQTDTVPGIILDVTCLGVQLRGSELAQAEQLKQEAMITILPPKVQKAEKPKQPAAVMPIPAPKAEEKCETPETKQVPQEKPEAPQEEPKPEPSAPPEKKPGLLERLFGKKSKKTENNP